MALAPPDCRRVGIDPAPSLTVATPGVEIYCMTSDKFFAKADLSKILGGLPIDLAFIDGMHLFENVLADFINLERYCAPESAILIHDRLPLIAVVAERERQTRFWLGDVWRTLPALAHFRPDLAISVVAAAPSGLAVVRGLDPTSDILATKHQQVLTYGAGLDFRVSQSLEEFGIESVPSDRRAVSQLWQGRD